MVQEREDSGLSVKAFCKQAGIAPKTYYYRLRRLREAAIKQTQLGAVQPKTSQPELVQYTQPTGYVAEPTPQSESWMWVYGSDGRSGEAIRIFEYRPDRSGERCKRFLSSFTGCLVTDGYAGYNAVENVTQCGCWAHMCRAWRDVMPKGATMENSKAAVGYNYCNKLFALERKWKNLNNAQREENRRNQAEKLVDEYFLWVRSVDPISGSKLEDAVKYALNQEKYLRAF